MWGADSSVYRADSNAHQDGATHNHPPCCNIGFYPVQVSCRGIQRRTYYRVERVPAVAGWFGNPRFEVTIGFETKLTNLTDPTGQLEPKLMIVVAPVMLTID